MGFSSDLLSRRLLILAVISSVLAQISYAYNSNNRLVTYTDHIKIANSTDPNTVIYETDLFTFPYVTEVS